MTDRFRPGEQYPAASARSVPRLQKPPRKATEEQPMSPASIRRSSGGCEVIARSFVSAAGLLLMYAAFVLLYSRLL
jgi:hypothetical protein